MCALQPLAEYRSANADGHMREQYVLGPRASAPRAGSFCSGSLFRQIPDLSHEHVGARGDAISEIVIVFEEGQSFRKRVQTTAHLALLFVCLFLLALLFLLELHRCEKQACHANIEAYSLWYHSRKNKGTLVQRATCAHLRRLGTGRRREKP